MWGGRPSCPLGLSRDPQLSQQTFTRPHTKHPPGRRGGVASFPFQTEGWNRGRTEGRKKKKKECNLIFLLLWCLRNAAFCPRLFPATLLCHFWSQAANLLIIAAKGWTCDLNSYFRSAVQREQRQSQQDGESSSLNCHTAKVRLQDCSDNGRWQQLTLSYRGFFLLAYQAKANGSDSPIKRTLRHRILAKKEQWSKITRTKLQLLGFIRFNLIIFLNLRLK